MDKLEKRRLEFVSSFHHESGQRSAFQDSGQGISSTQCSVIFGDVYILEFNNLAISSLAQNICPGFKAEASRFQATSSSRQGCHTEIDLPCCY